jgi:hypothetical protein
MEYVMSCYDAPTFHHDPPFIPLHYAQHHSHPHHSLLHFTSLIFRSLPFRSLPFHFLHFTSLHFTPLHFTATLKILPIPSLRLIYHYPNPFPKIA